MKQVLEPRLGTHALAINEDDERERQESSGDEPEHAERPRTSEFGKSCKSHNLATHI